MLARISGSLVARQLLAWSAILAVVVVALRLRKPQLVPSNSQREQVDAWHVDQVLGKMVGQQQSRPLSKGATAVGWGIEGRRLGLPKPGHVAPRVVLSTLKVVSVAASRHSLLATDTGLVYSMGSNNSRGGGGHGSQPIADAGQLGRGPAGDAPAAAVQGLQVEVVQVASGRYHSLALARNGSVYSWGLNDQGQLGRPALSERAPCTAGGACHDGAPKPVPALPGVVALAAGRYNSMALDLDGRLWVWGYDGCADGGLPAVEARQVPRSVGGSLAHAKVVAFDAGYTFWVAADERGKVHTCSTGDDGYAGTLPSAHSPNHHGELGRAGDPLVPLQVTVLRDEVVVAVAAGRHHAVVSTARGRVFSWGGREGRTPVQKRGALIASNVLYVAAGEYFSLAASADAVYGWGLRAYAGLNETTDSHATEPEMLTGALSPPRWSIVGLAAGYQHAFALVQPREPPGTGAGAPAPGLAGPPAVANRHSQQAVHSAANISHTAYLAQALSPNYTVADYWGSYKPSKRHSIIASTSPDVFPLLPKEYDKGYRNPCWWVGDQFRCLPYFHILGVSKCGTTDLYHRLVQHPDMYQSANKGPHFWDECKYPPEGACTVPPSGDFEGYVGLFSEAATTLLSQPQGITGEASSNTFTATNGVYLRGFTAPRYPTEVNVTMAELLREVQPYMRLIIMFRDPVDRYYSAHHYYRRKDPPDTAEEVHRTAVNDLKIWKECVRQHSQQHCVRMYHPQQLVKGMYSEFIEDWLKHWPREQLLFLRLEDYQASTKPHLAAVFRFLGMAAPTAEQWQKILEMPTRNSQRHRNPKILQETRTLLQTFYQPFNDRLGNILQDSRWQWDSTV